MALLAVGLAALAVSGASAVPPTTRQLSTRGVASTPLDVRDVAKSVPEVEQSTSNSKSTVSAAQPRQTEFWGPGNRMWQKKAPYNLDSSPWVLNRLARIPCAQICLATPRMGVACSLEPTDDGLDGRGTPSPPTNECVCLVSPAAVMDSIVECVVTECGGPGPVIDVNGNDLTLIVDAAAAGNQSAASRTSTSRDPSTHLTAIVDAAAARNQTGASRTSSSREPSTCGPGGCGHQATPDGTSSSRDPSTCGPGGCGRPRAATADPLAMTVNAAVAAATNLYSAFCADVFGDEFDVRLPATMQMWHHPSPVPGPAPASPGRTTTTSTTSTGRTSPHASSRHVSTASARAPAPAVTQLVATKTTTKTLPQQVLTRHSTSTITMTSLVGPMFGARGPEPGSSSDSSEKTKTKTKMPPARVTRVTTSTTITVGGILGNKDRERTVSPANPVSTTPTISTRAPTTPSTPIISTESALAAGATARPIAARDGPADAPKPTPTPAPTLDIAHLDVPTPAFGDGDYVVRTTTTRTIEIIPQGLPGAGRPAGDATPAAWRPSWSVPKDKTVVTAGFTTTYGRAGDRTVHREVTMYTVPLRCGAAPTGRARVVGGVAAAAAAAAAALRVAL